MANTKIVYVTVALEVLRDADIQDIMSECDYSFEHSDIVETELMGETDQWVKNIWPMSPH